MAPPPRRKPNVIAPPGADVASATPPAPRGDADVTMADVPPPTASTSRPTSAGASTAATSHSSPQRGVNVKAASSSATSSSPPPSSSQSGRDDGDDDDDEGGTVDQDQDMHAAAPLGADAAAVGGQDELLASMPIYLSTSLPSTSSLHLLQFPVYPRGRPLPIPDSARERGLEPGIRWRPRARRVEVELPLDLRGGVYNAERGRDMARGASHGGTIGTPRERDSSSSRRQQKRPESGPRSRVKEEGTRRRNAFDDDDDDDDDAARGRGERGASQSMLTKARLESIEVPHATNYMIGVIRDGALHLTRVDVALQLRPSLHHLDGLSEIEAEEKRRTLARQGGEAGGGGELESDAALTAGEEAGGSAAAAAAAAKRRGMTLNVSVRGEAGGRGGGGPGAGGAGGRSGGGAPGGGGGGGGGSSAYHVDAREQLMAAQREAEAEEWTELAWRREETDEARRTFEARLFAGSKADLACTTRMSHFL